MIDIRYLDVIPKLSLSSGLEFLDWQDNTFFQEVSEILNACYSPETEVFDLSKKVRQKLVDTIKQHTNITATIVPEKRNNLAVDAGFISPNNVLNIRNLDYWLDKKYTKVAEAYKELKKNVINGYCDLRTGRVEGDFASINFNIYINVNIVKAYRLTKTFEKSKITAGEAVGAALLHECGHVFFNLHYASSSVVDNALLNQSVKMLVNEPDKNRRAIIIKDIQKETDIQIDPEFGSTITDPSEIYIIFAKGIKNRDYRRTLSLGVTKMTAEVLADAYAIRMGASHGLSTLLVGFNKPFYGWALGTVAGLLAFSVLFPQAAPALIMGISSMLGSIAGQLNVDLAATIYDTPYRRLKNILRENITYLNTQSKNLPSAEVNKLIAKIKELDRIAEENKMFFESTAVQRLIGWVYNGSDFRKTDFEHYTAELTNSNLAIHLDMFEQE